VLLANSEMSQDTGLPALLANLWNLAQKHSVLDANIMVCVCVCACACVRGMFVCKGVVLLYLR